VISSYCIKYPFANFPHICAVTCRCWCWNYIRGAGACVYKCRMYLVGGQRLAVGSNYNSIPFCTRYELLSCLVNVSLNLGIDDSVCRMVVGIIGIEACVIAWHLGGNLSSFIGYNTEPLTDWTFMLYEGLRSQDLYTATYRKTRTAAVYNWSGILPGTSIRQIGAISGSSLPEQTLDPQSAARHTHLCPSQLHYVLHPVMFSGSDSLFLVASITRYQLLLFLRTPMGDYVKMLQTVGPKSVRAFFTYPDGRHIVQCTCSGACSYWIGWEAESAWAPRVWITCSRLLLDSSPGGNQTCNLWVTSPRPYHHTTEPPPLL